MCESQPDEKLSDPPPPNEGVFDRPPRLPESGYNVCIRAFGSEDASNAIGKEIGGHVYTLSRVIDLSGLDGVTVAGDYRQALSELDRGYQTSHRLEPTEEFGVGVAMTPCVMRGEKLKSHIVLSADAIAWLADYKSEHYAFALHTLAHECAHVEVNDYFDKAFPDFLLRRRHLDAHDAFRWQIILACWDEFAATWISAPFGEDPTKGYEDTFLTVLKETREKANGLIRAYRTHRDAERVMGEVYGAYGNLMKFACYHLGNLFGQGVSPTDLPRTKTALDGHWFSPFFDRLGTVCAGITEEYGKWTDKHRFEMIGDIADDVVRLGGLAVHHLRDGSLYVHVTFSPDTMGDQDGDGSGTETSNAC